MINVRNLRACCWIAILFVGLVASACSGKADLQKQMSGVWEDRLGHETVELKLSGDAIAVKVAGKPYPAMIEGMDKEKGRIRLKVENGGGQSEIWTLTQMWEDSDRFNIVFERGDQKEVLIPKKKKS